MNKKILIIIIAGLLVVGSVKAISLGSIANEVKKIEVEVTKLLNEPIEEPSFGAIEELELGAIELEEEPDNSWQDMLADTVISKGTIVEKRITTSTKELADGTTKVIKTGAYADILYQGVTATASITRDGWNSCRRGVWGTTTKAYCAKRTKHQLNMAIKGEEERIDQQIKEDSWLDYSDELSDGGL